MPPRQPPQPKKTSINDEELDRQSHPPPTYDSVYPNGPPVHFNSSGNNSVTEPTEIISSEEALDEGRKKVVEFLEDEGEEEVEIEDDDDDEVEEVQSRRGQRTPAVANRTSTTVINSQPRSGRQTSSVRPLSTTSTQSQRTFRGRPPSQSSSRQHLSNSRSNNSRYRREVSSREEDQLCCCFTCCGLLCGQCMSICNGF